MLGRLLVAGLLLSLVPPAFAQGTQDPCPDAPPAVLFATTEASIENLAFDGNGSLFTTGGDVLLRFASDGSSQVALDGPRNGLVWGPDDRLYIASAVGEGTYDILRSTDASATEFAVYSSGLPTYNGMEFDGAGNLYVSDDNIAPPETPPDLVRVPAADPSKWEPWTSMYGPDGIVYDPKLDALYTVVPADQASPVIRFSPTDKTKSEVVAYLSFGSANLSPGAGAPQGDSQYPVPKGLDDLTLGPDGLLYIAAHLSGELIRFDPASGSACILASGLEEPSSVRIAHGFGEHGGKLFVTTFGGTGVSGLALGQAGMPPPGRIWVFDVGFVEEPGTGQVLPPPPANATTETGICIDYCGTDDPYATKDGKGASAGPAAFLALALLVAVARRRA